MSVVTCEKCGMPFTFMPMPPHACQPGRLDRITQLEAQLDEEQKRSDGYGAACAESEAQLAERTRERDLWETAATVWQKTAGQMISERDAAIARAEKAERERERVTALLQRWRDVSFSRPHDVTYERFANELEEALNG